MDYEFWSPGMAVPTSTTKFVGMDTETERFVANEFPPVVTLQVHCADFSHFVLYPFIPMYLDSMEDSNPDAVYFFHNASFDLGVMGNNPHLQKALEENRVLDTYVLDSLFCAETKGMVSKARRLSDLTKRHLDIQLDKDASIRLTFTRSMIDSGEGISPDHIKYAMIDAEVTYDVGMILTDGDRNKYPTAGLKTRMMVALDSISRRGFFVEEAERLKLREKFGSRMDDMKEFLSDWGWYEGEKGNAKVLQHILSGVEKDLGVEFERSEKTNAIRTTDEALAPIAGDEFVDTYKELRHASKMTKTYLGDKTIGDDGAVHTRFNLASTMRTTSSGPNIQNVPRKGGIRGMFIPRPGCVLTASDYSQLELCGLAQSCLARFGHSKLAEIINNDMDVHKYMATFLVNKPIEEIQKDERQLAKVANFGQEYFI